MSIMFDTFDNVSRLVNWSSIFHRSLTARTNRRNERRGLIITSTSVMVYTTDVFSAQLHVQVFN